MTYSPLKAAKLKKEFKYIIGQSYYPFGKEGREFKITGLKEELEYGYNLARLAVNGDEKRKKEFEEGKNWRVVVTIKGGKDVIEKDLEEVLKVLKIRHDIANINEYSLQR
jgi:hypothetical protein